MLSTITKSNNRGTRSNSGQSGLSQARALVYNSVGQNIPTSVSTAVRFDSEVYDTANLHDNAINNSRFTVPIGFTLAKVTGNIDFTANLAGIRQVNIAINGTSFIGGSQSSTNAVQSGLDTLLNVSCPIFPVNVGDFIEIFALQNSGAGLIAVGITTWFAIELF